MSSAPPGLAPLFGGLFDDAAIFPPGNATLVDAVEAHLRRQTQTGYEDLVGPLLVRASDVPQLVELAAGRPMRVVVIGRPGTDVCALREGADRMAGTSLELAGVDLGWQPGWRELLGLGAPVAVELPRDSFDEALDDVVEVAHATRKGAVLAKFRTGATPTHAWPDEHELAGVLTRLVGRGVPFKLTGGLHHLVRADHGEDGAGDLASRDPQHGLLGVLAAVDLSIDGATPEQVAAVLGARRAEPLADRVRSWTPARITEIRGHFTSFGCCDVTEPIAELAELGLLDPPGRPAGSAPTATSTHAE